MNVGAQRERGEVLVRWKKQSDQTKHCKETTHVMDAEINLRCRTECHSRVISTSCSGNNGLENLPGTVSSLNFL